MNKNGANEKKEENNRLADKPISELVNEWENLISELSSKEIALYNAKEAYQIASDKIIEETDFKEIYGRNNAEIRKNHVKTELYEDYNEIKELEFSIQYIINRIQLIKEIVKLNNTIMALAK